MPLLLLKPSDTLQPAKVSGTDGKPTGGGEGTPANLAAALLLPRAIITKTVSQVERDSAPAPAPAPAPGPEICLDKAELKATLLALLEEDSFIDTLHSSYLAKVLRNRNTLVEEEKEVR